MTGPVRWKARYTVLSVLFVTWIVSLMDRMVMSIAMPFIAKDFQLSPFQSGLVLSVFFASYSLAQVPGGMLADRFGVRRVTTIALLWWSAFTALTGSVGSVFQMIAVRFAFGLGEGMFPGCAFKTVANWFPVRERGTANAIMLSSNAIGGALAPLVVVGIMSIWGWRAVFHSLFVPGIVIAFLFWKLIPDHPSKSGRISAQELAEIEKGTGEDEDLDHPSFIEAFRQPYVLRYFLVYFTFEIGYWGFTTWLPTYLIKERGFSLVQMGAAASLPFFAGAVGYLVGGWLSDRFFSTRRGVPIIVALLCSGLMLYATFTASSVGALVVCQTIAGFFLHLIFGAFWAMPLNVFSRRLMGVTCGFINMGGQAAAFLSPILIGYLLQISGGSFRLSFGLMIGALLVSAALVLTLPGKFRDRDADEAAVA